MSIIHSKITDLWLCSLIMTLVMALVFSTSANAQALSKTAIEATPAEKQILAHGKNELKKYCYKCHTDEVYTRKNHFIKSLKALKQQVSRCKNNANAPWFDEDTSAVVQFLNQKYYKF